MTNTKALLTAGLLLSASAVLAAPTAELKGIGAKTGVDATATIVVHPNGTKLGAAVFVLEASAADAANVELVATGATAPSGWDTPVTNQIMKDGKKWILSVNTTATPSDADPLVFTVKLNQKAAGFKATKLTLVGYDEATGDGSNLSDDQYNTVGLAAVSGAIVNGASRDLGGPMNNAVSVAPGYIAAVAGSTLWLLDPASDSLAPVAAAAAGIPLASTVSNGRPAFGSIDGVLAVATGSDDGTLTVVKTTDASKIEFKQTLTSATTPAIAPNGIVYVAGKTAGGASVVSVKVAGGSAVVGNEAAIGGATDVQSSPAVAGNTLVVGTNNSVFYANVDANGVITPRTNTAPTGVAFNTSPVVSGAFAFIGASDGKVYKIALANGNSTASTATLPVPLSDPFAMNGKVHFGVGDGRVATFATGDVTVDPTYTVVGTTPVVQPVDTGTLVVAGTQSGIVMAGANSVDLGPTLGKAVAVLPGTTPIIVVNKVDGTVYAIPAS